MDKKRKILPWLIICVLLTSTSIYFLDIVINRSPNFELSSKSYDEKMESLDWYLYGTLIYIKNSVEPNSKVLFFNNAFFILGRPFLYPKVKVEYYHYTNDENLLRHIQEYLIDYIIIISSLHHLANYTTLFTKIEYYPQIYLLKINRSAL